MNKISTLSNKFKPSILWISFVLIGCLALFVQNGFAQGATCGAATPIAIGSCTGVQTISDFTAEVSSPAVTCAVGTFRREGWYSFTVPAGPAQNITVSGYTSTTNADLIIQVISGTCVAQTQVTCANAFVGSGAQFEGATATALAPGTYFIRIMNYGSAVNMTMDNICVNTTPTNNGCPGTTITPSASCTAPSPTAGTLVGATFSTLPGTSCNPTNFDVWYNFTALGTSQTITVTPSGTMDAAFEVFSGSCVGGTEMLDVLGVACEDNVFGVFPETGTFSGLTPGSQYWIRVYDATSNMATASTFTISIITLSNDDCSGAITLTPGVSCTPTSGCVDNATDSGITPVGCAAAAVSDDDVWYKFVATATSHVVTVAGSASFSPVIEVYSSCGGPVVTGGCATGGAGSTITATLTGLTATATYYIRVYDAGTGYPATTTFTICVGNAPPANNNCSGAIPLTASCTPTAVTGTDASATQSLPATCTGVNTANDDVWYSFTTSAVAGQPYVINVTGSASFDPVFQVYSGSCAGLVNVTCINANTGGGTSETTTLNALIPSSTYYIRVYDATTAAYPATMTFTISVTTPPINDGCPGTVLFPSATCTNTVGNLCGATSSGVAATCGGTPTDDVWYSFTAASTTQIITVTPCGTMNPVIQVFSGSCGGTSIACANLTGTGVAETVTITTVAAVQYWIRVYDFTGAPVCTAFGICVTTPPVNDNCTGAITLTPATNCSNTAGTDAGATLSPTAASACGGNPNDDVWYTFTAAAANQTITVVPCASFNAVIELYSGSCGALTYVNCVNAGGAGVTENLVMTTLTPGTPYWIRVYDFGAGYPACNTFTVCVVTPYNDFCTSALSIGCPSTTNGCTTSACGTTLTGDPTTPCVSASPGAQGIWYVIAGTGQNITANTCGGITSYDTQIWVYSGTCGSLTCVTGNDDQNGACGLSSLVTFGTVVGTNYYIFVNGYAGGTGNFTLTVSCATPPSNDQCAGAIPITCSGTVTGNTTTASGLNDITGCGGSTAINPVALWYVYNGVDNYNAGDSSCITITLSGCNFGPSSNVGQLAVWQAPNACTVPYWTATAGGVGGLPLSTSAVCCNGTFICKAGVGSCGSVNFVTYFGVRYFIEVYGAWVASFSGSQRGTFTLSIASCINPLTGLSGCAPLPIQLLSFTGHPEGPQNLLEWKTATETNNDYFTLEKSVDGINFNPFYTKAGAGNSISLQSYNAYDGEPNNGITYYRLKQTDHNSAYTYSDIIAVENTRTAVNLSNVHPNPTTSDVNFDFYTSIKGKVHISIADYLGQVVAEEDQNAAIGNSTLSAKMAQLPRGVYSMKVTFDQTGYVSVTKVVKN